MAQCSIITPGWATISSKILQSQQFVGSFFIPRPLIILILFFILLKGGKPIFLQEYHHFGAVWSWFLPLYVDSSAIIIATLLNSFVHTVMYYYYSLSVFDSRKWLVPIKPLITTMQLVQFFFYICNTGYISKHAHNQDWKFMMAIYVFRYMASFWFCCSWISLTINTSRKSKDEPLGFIDSLSIWKNKHHSPSHHHILSALSDNNSFQCNELAQSMHKSISFYSIDMVISL